MVGKVCKRGFTIQVLRSGAGYYLGTLDKDGCPYCRISTGYSKTYDDALKELKCDRTYASETLWCNGGTGCFGGDLS